MKGLLNRIALALIISVVSLTAVNAANGIDETITEGSVVLLKFENIKSDVANVILIDTDGIQLWSELIEGATSFSKQLNLGQLPDGRYKVIMTDGEEVHTQSITKSIDEIYVTERTVMKIIQPTMVLNNKRLKIGFPVSDTKINSVSFQSAEGDIFFTDKVNYMDSFAKAYNLKKLDQGDFTVIIETDQKTFYKSVLVK